MRRTQGAGLDLTRRSVDEDQSKVPARTSSRSGEAGAPRREHSAGIAAHDVPGGGHITPVLGRPPYGPLVHVEARWRVFLFPNGCVTPPPEVGCGLSIAAPVAFSYHRDRNGEHREFLGSGGPQFIRPELRTIACLLSLSG